MKHRHGFTTIELLVAIAILVIIGGITLSVLYGAKPTKNLEVITDGLQFTLAQAKSDAMVGKHGSSYGVLFASTSYSYFVGSSYDPSTTTSKTTVLPANWQLATTTSSGHSYVSFARITGSPQTTATVTITYMPDRTLTRQITIGPSGNISVIK